MDKRSSSLLILYVLTILSHTSWFCSLNSLCCITFFNEYSLLAFFVGFGAKILQMQIVSCSACQHVSCKYSQRKQCVVVQCCSLAALRSQTAFQVQGSSIFSVPVKHTGYLLHISCYAGRDVFCTCLYFIYFHVRSRGHSALILIRGNYINYKLDIRLD